MIPRIRTINQTVRELKKEDPETAITPFFVRQLCIEGAGFSQKSGDKYLINLDVFYDFLSGNCA